MLEALKKEHRTLCNEISLLVSPTIELGSSKMVNTINRLTREKVCWLGDICLNILTCKEVNTLTSKELFVSSKIVTPGTEWRRISGILSIKSCTNYVDSLEVKDSSKELNQKG